MIKCSGYITYDILKPHFFQIPFSSLVDISLLLSSNKVH